MYQKHYGAKRRTTRIIRRPVTIIVGQGWVSFL